MIKNVVILCAGNGTKMWPYSEIRNKVMVPVANKPLISYNVDALFRLGVDKITIVTGKYPGEIANYFSAHSKITFINAPQSKGTAESLLAAKEQITDSEPYAVLYGDTIVDIEDLKTLLNAQANSVLLAKSDEPCLNFIGGAIEECKLKSILGHARDSINHSFTGFVFNKDAFKYLSETREFMRDLQVGTMPVMERFIESALSDMMNAGHSFNAFECANPFYDLDKPWHLLEASQQIVTSECSKLTQNELGEGSTIDPTADIRGFVKLGKNSKIGRNVIIEGNIIAGDNTIIDNGALIQPNVVIGSNVFVGNYCFVSSGSAIGNDCFLGHAAEFWGILMRRVFLYHYMEMYGIIGENTDIGAGTMCGTLRFDDGETPHIVKSRREMPIHHSNAIYIGDFSRTGVGAILLPGVKTGAYSLVGPGVVQSSDLPTKKAVFVKQEQIFKDWNPEKYGW